MAPAGCLFAIAAAAVRIRGGRDRFRGALFGRPWTISAVGPHRRPGAGIAGYARAEDASFLEYAEWYIVWSYREKAAVQQARLPFAFQYFGAIGQYWSGYCCSYEVVRGRYPFNLGDHLMLVVIGTSFTRSSMRSKAHMRTPSAG